MARARARLSGVSAWIVQPQAKILVAPAGQKLDPREVEAFKNQEQAKGNEVREVLPGTFVVVDARSVIPPPLLKPARWRDWFLLPHPVGSDDNAWLARRRARANDAERAQRAFPGSRLVWFEHSSHFPMWDEPAKAAALILEAT